MKTGVDIYEGLECDCGHKFDIKSHHDKIIAGNCTDDPIVIPCDKCDGTLVLVPSNYRKRYEELKYGWECLRNVRMELDLLIDHVEAPYDNSDVQGNITVPFILDIIKKIHSMTDKAIPYDQEMEDSYKDKDKPTECPKCGHKEFHVHYSCPLFFMCKNSDCKHTWKGSPIQVRQLTDKQLLEKYGVDKHGNKVKP